MNPTTKKESDETSNINHSLHQKQPNSRYCFVCGIENPYGLKVNFYESGPGEVVVDTIVPDRFQGYPGVVHGGIVASLVDEALGRAHMGQNTEKTRFLYTVKLCIHYRKPVPTNVPIRIVGQAVRSKKRTATSIAKIFDQDGQLLVEADAVLINVPEEQIGAVDLDELGWMVYPD